MKYFAFGSNLSRIQMKGRCPQSEYLCTGTLQDYEFVYDGYSDARKGAVGNVLRSPGRRVLGAIYEVTQDDISKLDGYEVNYSRSELSVIDEGGKEVLAYVYHRDALETGRPSDSYRSIIVDSARELEFPHDYISEYLNRK